MPTDDYGHEILSESEINMELARWEKWEVYLKGNPEYEGLFESEDGDNKLKIIRTAVFYHKLFREGGPRGEEKW